MILPPEELGSERTNTHSTDHGPELGEPGPPSRRTICGNRPLIDTRECARSASGSAWRLLQHGEEVTHDTGRDADRHTQPPAVGEDDFNRRLGWAGRRGVDGQRCEPDGSRISDGPRLLVALSQLPSPS